MVKCFRRMKRKLSMIILINTETPFDKLQYHIKMKLLNKHCIIERYLSMTKVTCIKQTDNIIVDVGRLKAFSLKPTARCLGTGETATQLRVYTALAEIWNLIPSLKSVSQQSIALAPGTPLTIATSLALVLTCTTHKNTKMLPSSLFQPSSQILGRTLRKEIEIKEITVHYLSITLANT